MHAHFGPMGGKMIALRETLGIPLVTTFYGFDMAPGLTLPNEDWPDTRERLFAEGDMFLVEGPAMRQALIALGCPEDKVRLQRIAIDLAKVPFSERTMPVDGRARIVFAGRIYEKKGLAYALEALTRVRDAGRAFDMRIIGSGSLQGELEEYAVANGLAASVHWLGFLGHADYVRQLQTASIFIHPSVTAEDGDTEGGAPTVLLEAQAMGIPIVSTVHADIPYVTVPGTSALLAPERDPDALAEALIELIDDPASWPERGRAGRAKIEAHHDIEVEVRSLEAKYRMLLEGAGDGAT